MPAWLRRARNAAGLAAATALVLAACGGSGGDKAGGADDAERVVLTLGVDDRPEVEEFADLVERLSEGSVRIEIADGWRVDEPDYEQRTVKDAQQGKVELVSVGARIWDTLGVNDFRGLLAPFLIDSLALEGRVLDVSLRDRLLESLEPLGLVGLAVLPGDLRRPAGISRPLVRPADYRGATIGIREGGVPEATFRALGSVTAVFEGGTGTIFGKGLDGAEFGLVLIADNMTGPGGERVRAVTANVAFWPKVDTIVMNRRVFDELSSPQQDVLRRAGQDVFGRQFARIEETEREAIEAVCQRGLEFVTASPADVAALRAAVQPVYVELERDPGTRKLIGEIGRLRRQVQAAAVEQPRCTGSDPRTVAPRVAGVWLSTATRKDVLTTDAPKDEIELVRSFPEARRVTIDLENGRWVGRADDFWEVSGTYRLRADVIRFTIGACKPVSSCDPGAFTEYSWSLYRDTLTFARIPGRWTWPYLVAKPWVRVG